MKQLARNASVSTTSTATSRRDFLKASAATGGLVIGFNLFTGNRIAHAQAAPPVVPPNAFLRIARDGSVTVQVKHLEFGQGVMTSLPMMVAEELDCDWSKVRSELAPAAPQYAHTMFGMQITGGSSSVVNSFTQMRTAGAMARSMLISAAAAQWKVDPAQCSTANGSVIGPGGRKAGFGEFADAANALKAPEKVALKDARDFRIIGKPTRRIDAPAKVNGTAKFGLDVTPKMIPNLHTAVVKHPPMFGARVAKIDASKVNGLPGVTHVVQISNGVAVVAKNFWAAKKGRDLLQVTWDFTNASKASSADLKKAYRDQMQKPGAVAKAGNADAVKTAAKSVTAEYDVPFLAHAPMEPLNCTVEFKGDGCEIWVGSQFQTVDQGAAAKVAGLKPEQVKLNTMIAGGGFGRRANPASDYIIEAVEIAKEAKVPVKTVWTREDDIKGGYYRPMYVHKVSAGLDAAGKIVGWDHTVVGQSIIAGTPFEPFMVKDGVDATSVEGIADTPYDIPGMRATLHSTKDGIPSLWWRSVGHTHTAFVMETMMDELAKAAGQDPVEFRRGYLAKHPRVLKVLNLAAEKSGWGSKPAKGVGRGIAVHESFGSVCAHVADVSIDKGQIKVLRVVSVIDCGLVVNPLTVTAQVESATAYGLSAALYGQVTLKDGEVEQSNFHDYPVLRLNEMPKMEVHFVEGGTMPTGVGEPGTPPVAPAVANAVFALTGKRLREMPFKV
ncbi:MAG: xanthine dehydrogenase family protein molybdopterin-binding subunit [Betaproteobacteria bacterium]|nr:xanthine dehydrogenase family protein molybdopterin-binding subunit [Betaproteobacteria bacterium]